MADDRIRPVSEHNPKPTTPEAPTEYWLLCDCERCQVSRSLFTDLVKAAMREAVAEGEPLDWNSTKYQEHVDG